MKKLSSIALIALLIPALLFAGSKTKNQWLYSLPVDGKLWLPYGECIDNSTTDGVISFTDGTNTLMSITDTGTLGTLTTTGKRVATPVTHAALSATTQITLTSAFTVISSSGGAVTNTAAPLISTATATNPNGTRAMLIGSSDTDIPTLSDSACFALGAATRAMGVGDILELIIYNGIWYEVGFTNN